MTVHGSHPYLPQAPLLPRGPSNVLPGGQPPPPQRRSRLRCGGSAALCVHTPSIGGTLWGCKSTKGCRRVDRSRRLQRCRGPAPGDLRRGPGLGRPATHGDESLLPPHSPSPGYPQQRLGGQEGEHTLHHLREVTQHIGTSRVGGGGAAAAHRLHSSPTGQKPYGSSEAERSAHRRPPGPTEQAHAPLPAGSFRHWSYGSSCAPRCNAFAVRPERNGAAWPLSRLQTLDLFGESG